MINESQLWVDLPALPIGTALVAYIGGSYRIAAPRDKLPELAEWARGVSRYIESIKTMVEKPAGAPMTQTIKLDKPKGDPFKCLHEDTQRRTVQIDGSILCLDCNRVIQNLPEPKPVEPEVNHSDSQKEQTEP